MIQLNLSEVVLLDRLRAGDYRAFDEIYSKYWKILLQRASRFAHSQEDAKDIVQTVFVKLWQKRATLSIQVSLDAYFLAAIRYEVINYFQSRDVKLKHQEVFRSTLTLVDNSTQEAIEYNKSEDPAEILDQAIEKLPLKMQEVFKMSRYDQLTIDEISERLSISSQTVKNQISNALKRLQVGLKS